MDRAELWQEKVACFELKSPTEVPGQNPLIRLDHVVFSSHIRARQKLA